MNSKVWINKALSTCLILVTIVAYSMVALANSEKIAGELLIAGTDSTNVTVNGETAKNGRSIFSSSTIITPENTTAIINVGKLGSIKLAPKTTLNLSFNEKGITGDLLSGKITVLNSADSVNIITLDGKLTKLNAGESAATTKTQDDDDESGAGSGAWFIWALVLGGAAAGLVIAATQSNDVQLGGGTTVVSPRR